MTSTLTVQQITGWAARITYTRDPDDDIGKADTVTLYRVTSAGSGIVMGAHGAANGSTSWDDPEAPLEQPAIWKLVGGNGAAIQTPELTITAPTSAGMGGVPAPILSDPYRRLTAPCIVGVEILSCKRASRAQAVNVEGRSDRVIISDVESGPARAPRLITETTEAADAMDRLCQAGQPLLLRCPGQLVTDRWLQITGDRSSEPFAAATSPIRLHTISETQDLDGAPDPYSRPAGDTLGDLHAAKPGTLQDIAAAWDTLDRISATDLRAMV